jgi:hypothetical protein
MRDVQKSEEKEEQTETDFQSFRESREVFDAEVRHGVTGMARLRSCEVVSTDNLPERYQESWYPNEENLLLFEAAIGKSDKVSKVVCPAGDSYHMTTMLQWTGADSIDELAGKRVPVRHIMDDYYEIEPFSEKSLGVPLEILPVSVLRMLINKRWLQFNRGKWDFGFTVTALIATVLFAPVFLSILLAILLPSVIGASVFVLISVAHIAAIIYNSR